MGIFDDIGSFFHPEDAYKAAGNQLQKYYGQSQGFLQPYSNNGMNIFQRLMDQSNKLNNPAALENEWASGYSESPYAKTLSEQAKNSGLDAASSMGLLGSSAALHNIQNSAGQIMQSDRQNYMNDIMNKYLASIGIGQNIYGIGANSAGAMSTNASNMGTNMAQEKYAEEAAPGELFGKLAGTGIGALLNFQTGGLPGVTSMINSR